MRNTLKIIILLMFICGMVFLICGHIDYYTEQAVQEIDDEYLGTAQAEVLDDAVQFTFADGTSFEIAQDVISGVDLSKELGLGVHVYADLAEINAHTEKRTIVTGRLKEESDKTFYRLIRIKCAPLTDSNVSFTQNVDHSLIKWQEDRKK